MIVQVRAPVILKARKTLQTNKKKLILRMKQMFLNVGRE